MVSTITDSSYLSNTDIFAGNNGKTVPRTLSDEIDRNWLKLNFHSEVERFLEYKSSTGASYGMCRSYQKCTYWGLWLLSKNRHAVCIDKISVKDLEHLKIELDLRNQKYPNRIVRVFAAFVSYTTNRPPLIGLGRLGEKNGNGIVGKKGPLATSEELERIDKKYGEILSSFSESEKSSGITEITATVHRRNLCACINVLENRGTSIPEGVTQEDLDHLKKTLKEKDLIGRNQVFNLFSRFLAHCGNRCECPAMTELGKAKTDWTIPYLVGFRFPAELEQYRNNIRNRGIAEKYVKLKTTRVIVCSRILDSLYGDRPLDRIDLEMTEGLVSLLQKHLSKRTAATYVNAYFEFVGYFGIHDYHSDLIKSKRTYINFSPKNETEERFLEELKE